MGQQVTNVGSFTIVIDRSRERTVPDKSPDNAFSLAAGFSTPDANITVLSEKALTGRASHHVSAKDDSVCLVLGDDQDAVAGEESPFLGNGIVVRARAASRALEIFSSISGLPAAFIYRDAAMTVVASSIRNIAAVPGIRLKFDPQGLKELAAIGHPIEHRTLFEKVSIVPAGTRLTLVDERDLQATGTWTAADTTPYKSWPDYIEAQVAAMRAAVARLDLNHSFLSLTAGLDTRAIFALLTERSDRIPTFTMSGQRTTLDAKRAKQLSEAYGFAHRTISIDSTFVNNLPQHVSEASLLSGGLSSLGQAFEVHFYRSISSGLTARISGNLGNQIGRSGTEGTGARNVNLDLLTPDFRTGKSAGNKALWLKDSLAGQDARSLLFLIQDENLHASLGNSCIGSHFAVQQTPYADRTLIAQKLRQPPLPDRDADSILKARLRDLRHRFLGQPLAHSFQRRIVRDVGGFVANCPVNWGWRARGGVSLGGLLFGAMAISDVVLGSRFGRNPVARNILSSLGVLGFSSFQADDMLGNPAARQFVADTLLSAENTQNGVLNKKQIRSLADRDFSDKAVRPDVEFALDVAMAQRHFLS